MSIDYSRLRSLTARELNAALLADGFTLARNAGAIAASVTPTVAA
jgi:predicted RNA binding protein YcfA (HicA-like mRNA interferase family)